jgi:hypothetical protein
VERNLEYLVVWPACRMNRGDAGHVAYCGHASQFCRVFNIAIHSARLTWEKVSVQDRAAVPPQLFISGVGISEARVSLATARFLHEHS